MDISGILRAQALSLRVQADRMEQLADLVESGEIPASSKVVVDIAVDPESRIRNALSEVPSMRHSVLADRLKVSDAELRRHIRPLIVDRKVGSIKGADGQWVYSWVFMDPSEGGNPTEARTQAPSPSSAPGGVQPLSPRNEVQRIRTTRKMGRAMSTPGSRGAHKRREQAYTRQQEAQQKRREEQAKKNKELSPAAAERKRANQEKAERDKKRRGTETRKGAANG